MSPYAEGTSVPAAQTQMEIQSYLAKRGCSSVGMGFEPGAVIVVFAMKHPDKMLGDNSKIHVSFRMPMPSEQRMSRDAFERRVREKWRALGLAIKSKFVSIDAGVESFEEAWLPHIVIPGGGTVGEHVLPAVREAYRSGKKMPPLLGSGT